MSSSVELFAYPWDILDDGCERFTDRCVELGVHRLHVTTSYHSGRFLLPRNSRHRVYHPSAGIYFRPPEGTFDHVRPDINALAHTDWLPQLAAACEKRKLALCGWTVVLHNSMLGASHSDLVIRNVFGDPYPFALCPSQAQVQDYAVRLSRSVAESGYFDTIDLETVGYLGYFHGHHHEVTAVPTGPMERFLLSLCFCGACKAMAERASVDADHLGEQVQRVLLRKFQTDDAAAAHPENAEQIATALLLIRGLSEFVRARMNTVECLLRRIRSETGSHKLAVFTSSFVGSPSNIWMEGVNIAALGSVIDVLHLLAYTPDDDAVNGDLVFCLWLLGRPDQLNLTLNLGLPVSPTLGHALAKVAFAWQQGVRRFSFFNYGFLGERRLQWIREISHRLRDYERSGK